MKATTWTCDRHESDVLLKYHLGDDVFSSTCSSSSVSTTVFNLPRESNINDPGKYVMRLTNEATTNNTGLLVDLLVDMLLLFCELTYTTT